MHTIRRTPTTIDDHGMPSITGTLSSCEAAMDFLHAALGRPFLQRRTLIGLRSLVRNEQTFRGLCLDIAPSLFPH